jgi:NurA-like 5'-3' nuclease
MANIMVNKICNLKCTYCFANKYVNTDNYDDVNNISVENFNKALAFVTTSEQEERLGIIGGEPTLHPELSELLDLSVKNEKINKVVLFTNGILLDKYTDILLNEKIGILINVNSPEDMGLTNFNKLKSNLCNLMDALNGCNKDKINIGLNIYSIEKDYSFIFDIMNCVKADNLRLSIVVPNTDEKRNQIPYDYFIRMKPTFLKFLKQCKENNKIIHSDCNYIPRCVWTDTEWNWIKDYLKEYYEKTGYRSNILNKASCNPVIDILPDMTAVRCFGCSFDSIQIERMSNLSDLKEYFSRRIDDISSNVAAIPECRSCYSYYVKQCSGGCIAFKRKKIEKVKDILTILDK